MLMCGCRSGSLATARASRTRLRATAGSSSADATLCATISWPAESRYRATIARYCGATGSARMVSCASRPDSRSDLEGLRRGGLCRRCQAVIPGQRPAGTEAVSGQRRLGWCRRERAGDGSHGRDRPPGAGPLAVDGYHRVRAGRDRRLGVGSAAAGHQGGPGYRDGLPGVQAAALIGKLVIFFDPPSGHGDGDQPGQQDRPGCPAPVERQRACVAVPPATKAARIPAECARSSKASASCGLLANITLLRDADQLAVLLIGGAPPRAGTAPGRPAHARGRWHRSR